jgi:hypothetical protein
MPLVIFECEFLYLHQFEQQVRLSGLGVEELDKVAPAEKQQPFETTLLRGNKVPIYWVQDPVVQLSYRPAHTSWS